MINDLKEKCYERVTLGVEPNEIKNKVIYKKYGFTAYIKTANCTYPDGTIIEVEYYGKKLQIVFLTEKCGILYLDELQEYYKGVIMEELLKEYFILFPNDGLFPEWFEIPDEEKIEMLKEAIKDKKDISQTKLFKKYEETVSDDDQSFM